MSEAPKFDAFSPKEIADRIENVGVIKARMPLVQMAMLGVLAGGFIGLGALFSTLVLSDALLGFAVQRVLGGLVFSLGLILVVVAGAELFTGNNLLVIAWADGKIGTFELLRNWVVVVLANLVGAAGLAVLVYLAHHGDMNGGAVGAEYVKIAAAKCSLDLDVLFFRAVLCNLLVCIAVWMAMAGRSVVDKIAVIVFPISAFVAAGFEHSVANMYFIPLGMLLRDGVGNVPGVDAISWAGFAANLAVVIAGNIVGGSVLVALIYHLIYKRGAR